ncbi:GDT1-like protein 4 [Platanthera guangdongensis]|uniref:GDT1 family protein n=1 Tax=Platanthera guangdongensis TaxID=2320717 RepID=A0ABR2MB40_9ASPA
MATLFQRSPLGELVKMLPENRRTDFVFFAAPEDIRNADVPKISRMFLNAARSDGDVGGLGLAVEQDGVGLFDAFFASLSMILVSEIGDETFIIAALMAMRHPKSIVLSGALSALIVMTVAHKLDF